MSVNSGSHYKHQENHGSLHDSGFFLGTLTLALDFGFCLVSVFPEGIPEIRSGRLKQAPENAQGGFKGGGEEVRGSPAKGEEAGHSTEVK